MEVAFGSSQITIITLNFIIFKARSLFLAWIGKSRKGTKNVQGQTVIFEKRILATRYTQFGQELALVMQTTHAQRWQYPDVSTCVCFLPLKMYTGITKILEFEYKTCMF